MLQEERKYQPALARAQAAAREARIPYRICETASFSGGGRADVSDTFAAALWALDYLFVLASRGCSGVNMETGVNHLGWVSHYTPIGDDLAGHFTAAPEYYGLLAFAQAGRGDLIEVGCETGGLNLTAYATEPPKWTNLADSDQQGCRPQRHGAPARSGRIPGGTDRPAHRSVSHREGRNYPWRVSGACRWQVGWRSVFSSAGVAQRNNIRNACCQRRTGYALCMSSGLGGEFPLSRWASRYSCHAPMAAV